jgi:hypothetical protein
MAAEASVAEVARRHGISAFAAVGLSGDVIERGG